jgi:hypothetical protein
MNNSKLTSKFQATTPQNIRNILKLKAKALESTLNKWNSKNDVL